MIVIVVLFVIIYGYRKVNVFDSFVSGAGEGLGIVIKLFPSLLAMILGINIFVNSGVVSFVLFFLKPLFNFLNVPFDVLPLVIMKPLSGSFGLGFLNNVFGKYGVDSYISTLASVMQGSSDTTLYIITLYFGSVGIKNIRYALIVGLFADLFMVIMSFLLVPLLT